MSKVLTNYVIILTTCLTTYLDYLYIDLLRYIDLLH